MLLGQDRQKGHLGMSKFADEQIGNRHLANVEALL